VSAVHLVDLFSGAGGAAHGYRMAGFEVTGIDRTDQPRYAGARFTRADALDWLTHADLSGVDALHASPPCQAYAKVTAWRGTRADHPDLVTCTVRALEATGLPWVVENVPESPLRADVTLCGSMFGLRVLRHRVFQTSWHMEVTVPPCRHGDFIPFNHSREREYAMALGTGWMTTREARQAVPPAYTAFIGTELARQVRDRR
jgi:C-5 cytosine-specific DNA methylase